MLGFYITVAPQKPSPRAAVRTVNCWESDIKDARVTEEMNNLILLKLLSSGKGTIVAYNGHQGETNRATRKKKKKKEFLTAVVRTIHTFSLKLFPFL